jgi:hypothetical protein
MTKRQRRNRNSNSFSDDSHRIKTPSAARTGKVVTSKGLRSWQRRLRPSPNGPHVNAAHHTTNLIAILQPPPLLLL